MGERPGYGNTDREWEAAARYGYRDETFNGDVADMPTSRWPASQGVRGAQPGRRGRGRRVSTKVIVVLSLLSIVVGFCCTRSTLTLIDAVGAARDAQAQVTIIEGLLKTGSPLSTDTLDDVQTHLVILNGDLNRLQSALPGFATSAPVAASLTHTLTMATLMVQAGRAATDAGQILVPHLKGIFSDIGSSVPGSTGSTGSTNMLASLVAATPAPTATPAKPPNSATGPLTMDEVKRAQTDITRAGSLAQQALAERQQIDDAQLSRFGLGKIVTLLQKLDTLAPKLPTYLGYANTVMNALPTLMGLTRPAHYLLFDMDSDELRPSGGFLGNYALLTVQSGHLVGGVHLKDVITLDCPNFACPYNPIPSQYAWMNIDPSYFGMRDANLSPDYPTSAKMVMQQYQRESGQSVDGVVMITPEIIKDILAVTGPIKVAGFDQQVDAKNLQDVIHYYHILSGANGTSQGVSGTTQRKVIDTLLGGALLKKFGALDAAGQQKVLRKILDGFGTKDVQMYLVDPRVQSVLADLHMDSAITTPPGADALMATDANVGATYYNSDMKETVADTITFDAQGNALHDTTITYLFQKVDHLYTPLLLQHGVTWYTGVARIVVPDGATLLDWEATQCPTACYQADAPEQGHQVWAVRIQNLQRGQTVVLHFKWTTPQALRTANGARQYTLQLYRQAGNHVGYTITIKPPAGSKIALPLSSPFRTPSNVTPGTAAIATIPLLTKDTALKLAFTSG